MIEVAMMATVTRHAMMIEVVSQRTAGSRPGVGLLAGGSRREALACKGEAELLSPASQVSVVVDLFPLDEIIKRLEVPKKDLVFAGIAERIEDAPETLVGSTESYPLEFARGIVASTLPNASLPLSVAQLAQAIVLKVT